jgi:hypothetical protein
MLHNIPLTVSSLQRGQLVKTSQTCKVHLEFVVDKHVLKKSFWGSLISMYSTFNIRSKACDNLASLPKIFLSMEQSSSSGRNRQWASQEIPRLLRNATVHYRIYKISPLVSILSQTDPFYIFPTYSLRSILILSYHLHLGLPTEMLYAFFISPMCTTCPIALILFDLVTVIIFGEAYNLWSSSLCHLLQPPANSSLVGPYIPADYKWCERLHKFIGKNRSHHL